MTNNNRRYKLLLSKCSSQFEGYISNINYVVRIIMSVTEKNRKEHVVQTVNARINALNKLKNGVCKSDIAKQLNVHVRTVQRWQKNKKKILENEYNTDDIMKKRLKRIENPKFNIIDELTWLWFNQAKNAGVLVNGPQICMQARAMYIALGGTEDEFKASNGWLEKFKRRHNIRSMNITGKKRSSCADAAEKFVTWFENYIKEENLSKDQIFNCDETGLNFKNMPRRTLELEQESSTVEDLKEIKERITIMTCSNASGGFKLPLVVIGRSAKPTCLKNLTKLPVYYRNQKTAWMISSLFKEWFYLEFVPKVMLYLKSMKLPNKAVLLVDNCSSHPKELRIGNNIKVIFLPPNTAALIQPMDQGILQCLKLNYRFLMMEHVINNVNNGKETIEVVEKINLGNAMEWIAEAWDKVEPIIIEKSWNLLWSRNFYSTTWQNPVHNLMNSSQNKIISRVFHNILQKTELYAQIPYHSVHDWLSPPTILTPEEALSNEEIVQVITEEEKEKENGNIESDNSQKNSDSTIINEDMSDHLEKVLAYCQNHPDHFSKNEVSMLRRINMKIDDENEIIVPQHMAKSLTKVTN